MRASLIKYWDALRASYWFVPALMALSAIVLSFALTTIDVRLGADWLIGRYDWLHTNQPEGARALLSTIAGSMITVAGVTFSITIAAVAFASSQFGPRILKTFMEDRGNQVTLGTFIATFLYCLLVLRTVRSADTSAGGGPDAAGFVPHLSVLCAVLLAIISVGVLIYFIHHVPDSIQASSVTARIGNELGAHFRTFPERTTDEPTATSNGQALPLPSSFYETAQAVSAQETGYIHNINREGLFDLACERDLAVQVLHPPGRFVIDGQDLLLAGPPNRIDNKARRTLVNCFAQGDRRTAVQDPLFLIDELVEVAARALSPGVNDPFTAMNGMDWLRAGIVDFTHRHPTPSHHYDDEGTVRLVARAVTFSTVAASCFDALIPYASADRNASIHLMKTIGLLMMQVEVPAYRTILKQKADALLAASRDALSLPSSIAAVEQCYDAVERMADHASSPAAVAKTCSWLNDRV